MNPLTDFRNRIRQGSYREHTCGLFPEKAQFNVIILPSKAAEDFEGFCRLNKSPCPLVFKSDPSQYLFDKLGDIDIRIDIPAYFVYRNGNLSEERENIIDLWSEGDWVTFLLGCSFTFEYPLIQAGIRLKHVEGKKNVAMYKTNLPLNPCGIFEGNMVVSMRWIKPAQVDEVVRISGQYPDFHGPPVHIGSHVDIGIEDIGAPDYGEFVAPDLDDVPVFWGCGVTPQNCIHATGLPLVITHKPGSMLITNLTHQEVLTSNLSTGSV